MWYAKMYFSEKREFFQYDAAGTQGVPNVSREFPFLESLLSFLEPNCKKLAPALRQIGEDWNRLIAEDDRQAGTNAMVELAQLKQRHIYLELLYVRWYDRFSRMGALGDRVSAEYCERPVAPGEQTCREMGAFQQWTKKQTDDPVFRAYRKEYKRRFA